MFKTRATSEKEVKDAWYIIDATGLRLGRLASVAAEYLLGKNNPKTRDYLMPKNRVVVINAEKIDATPKRLATKTYTQYSGYPGGLRVDTMGELMEKFPERVIEKAVKGMLPRNRRGNAILASNLYVYSGPSHKHEAQQPKAIDIRKSL